MHELGIVIHLIKSVNKIAEEREVKEVREITLEVGQVSGVVKEYFLDAFEWAKKKEPLLKNCKLNYVTIAAISYCEDCKETYSTAKGKICPMCGGEHTYLISGRDVAIKDIKVI